MSSISVCIPESKTEYSVQFGEDFSWLHKQIEQVIRGKDVLVVTDENVFQKTNFPFDKFSSVQVIPAGELNKKWETVNGILEKAFSLGLDRSATFVAVGGGVVGDMTGFAASLFMRGCEFIQVPTTLLAQVDASVGGKTGINCRHGKNLIGAIYQPQAVWCCRQFLTTLPESEMKNGLAEMIKHGILGSVAHFEALQALGNQFQGQSQVSSEFLEAIFRLVPDSVDIKRKVVEGDEKEAHSRMVLNLGHTFGHAIELLSDFSIAHGTAVAMGTIMATNKAEKEGLCASEEAERIRNIFPLFGFDLSCPYSDEEIQNAMQHDKKKREGKLKLVLPKKIGKVVIKSP